MTNSLSLVGVNLAGGEFGPGGTTYGSDYEYPTHAEIDYEASKGMNVIRMPFLWERLQPTLGQPFNATEMQRIDDVVDYATSKGLKVVLDPHDYGRYNGQDIGSSAVPNSAFAAFWGQLAGHFATNSNVMFGLMNEPDQSSASGWLGSVNAAIAAIRATGATQEVLVPGIGYDGAWTWTTTHSDNANVIGTGVTDSANNYAFEVHQYLDGDGSGTSTSVASPTIGSDRLTAITNWATQNGKKLFLGEFGAGADQASITALGNMLSYMTQHSDVWQGGTYWAAGPLWGNYMFSAEPSNGVDKPQMTVLEQYEHGAAPTTGTTTTTSASAAATVGSGTDKLVLEISEDAYQGDAQYTVAVDGQQVGGTLTAHASHAAGQDDLLTVLGNWSPGSHSVSVNFLNDAYGGSQSTDRNLYVDGATIDGAAVPNSTVPLYSAGAQGFSFQEAGAAATSASNTATTSASAAATVGSGTDKLVLKVSEDAYQGDAQYTVAVDGQQVGGTLTAHASHAAGQDDLLTVLGNWSPGNHSVSVNFLNDAYGGSQSTDRNLYVDGATIDGAAVPNSTIPLYSAGAQGFSFQEAGAAATSASNTATVGSGTDKLVLEISEDAYQGDAQYTVAVDGQQIGGTLTAHASHAAGQDDLLTALGNWGSGNHSVSVTFLNDAYGGSQSTDRNLYVDGATLDGTAVPNSTIPLYSDGTQGFSVHKA